MGDWLSRYQSVWSIDFEFSCPPGERPTVACLVAREFHSRRLIRLTKSDLQTMAVPPFAVGEQDLFVAYFSSAEWNCFASLGWPLPARVLDLWCEFKAMTNGMNPVAGYSLLGCLAYFGCDSIGAAEKELMRQLAMRGGDYTASEMSDLLDYCQSDVDALDRLLPMMMPKIDFPRALLRGRYMCAVARMEQCGVPIDVDTLALLRRHWVAIKQDLIDEVDCDYGVYEGTTFKRDRFANYLSRSNIGWPYSPNGHPLLDDDTFREQVRLWPQLQPLRDLRVVLSELKLEKLSVGSDGRNRTMLRPFASKTGRNQPSNSSFIFGPSVWIRGLIKPPAGKSVAYIDWSQQELGIAAAMSDDRALVKAYRSSDPYLAFAKMARAVPSTATKQSHPSERERFKVCMLATQYGMTEYGLARKLNQPLAAARNLLQAHRDTFPTYWRWSQACVDQAMLNGAIESVFGWRLYTIGDDNARSLANFSMQANGAEMLRLACSELTEAGVDVCCPVHDAILVEGPTSSMHDVVATAKESMRRASSIVLDGFELESDAKVVTFPDRYMDEERGRTMWDRITRLASAADREQLRKQRPIGIA